jgi:energy-coupling factor transporter ATP-binding protein EcfA2
MVRGHREVELAPALNVIVGPNGSGKSAVLRALHRCELCGKDVTGSSTVHYFSAETMNPQAPKEPAGDLRNMALRGRGVFSSHGEILKLALGSLPIREGDSILVDEPEAGQDLDGVERLCDGFRAISAEGGQVIVASHHPFFLLGTHVIELVPGYADEVRRRFCRALCGPA